MNIHTETNATQTYRIRIESDEYAQAPEDDLVKITYNRASRYVLGDTPVSSDERAALNKRSLAGEVIALPVYAYVHGGATIRAATSNPFGCPWDSGMSGIAYMERKAWLAEHNAKRLTPALKVRALDYIRAIVETFANYLEGQACGWVVERYIDGEWTEMDACWGYYDSKYAIEDARATLAGYVCEDVIS